MFKCKTEANVDKYCILRQSQVSSEKPTNLSQRKTQTTGLHNQREGHQFIHCHLDSLMILRSCFFWVFFRNYTSL